LKGTALAIILSAGIPTDVPSFNPPARAQTPDFSQEETAPESRAQEVLEIGRGTMRGQLLVRG
jgi:hypothetical protein